MLELASLSSSSAVLECTEITSRSEAEAVLVWVSKLPAAVGLVRRPAGVFIPREEKARNGRVLFRLYTTSALQAAVYMHQPHVLFTLFFTQGSGFWPD